MGTRLSSRRPCACGCGQPADGRSRYRGDHHAILVAARRRLRDARRYAERRGHEFSLELKDVLSVVVPLWPADEGLSLRRVDPRRGFTADNIELSPTRGGRERRSTVAQLRRRLERLAQRVDLVGHVDAHDLAQQLVRQDSRCAVTGRLFHVNARLSDPDGLTVILTYPNRPPSPRNILLVTAWTAAAAGWGLERLVLFARDVARHQKRGRAERP